MSTTSFSSPTTAAESHGAPTKIYLALVPWLLFTFIAQHSTLKAGAVIALAGSVAIAAPALLRGRPKLLELGTIIAFAAFTYAAFAADPSTAHWVARYARAIAAQNRVSARAGNGACRRGRLRGKGRNGTGKPHCW